MNKRQLDAFYPLTLAARRLFHKLAHGAAALHHGSNVSVGMRAVLESIADGNPQTVPQMARLRPVTRQHIQGLVNALVDGGYVETIDNPAHKRSKLVSPTERGLKTYHRMRALENEAFNRVRLDATPEELTAATKVLGALIVAFEGPQWRAIVNPAASQTE